MLGASCLRRARSPRLASALVAAAAAAPSRRGSARAGPGGAAGVGARRSGAAVAAETRPRKGDPLFRDVWRSFHKKVHPDLFTRWPELAARNSDALQRLQGILNEAKSGEKAADDVMQPREETFEFFVRTGEEGTFMRVGARLRLAGGHCPDSLRVGLSPLLAACGLPTRFHWGPEYWLQTHVVRERPPGEDGEDDSEEGGDGGAPGGDPRRQHKRWTG